MKYFIAADHAGVEFKSLVKEIFEKRGHEVIDLGPMNKDRVDYPDFAAKLCKEVLEDENSKGILVLKCIWNTLVIRSLFPLLEFKTKEP